MHSPELMSVTKEVSQSFQAPFVPEPEPETGAVPSNVGQAPALSSIKQVAFPVVSAELSAGVNTATAPGSHSAASSSAATPWSM